MGIFVYCFHRRRSDVKEPVDKEQPKIGRKTSTLIEEATVDLSSARLQKLASDIASHQVEGYDAVDGTSVDSRVLTNLSYSESI